MALQTKKLLFVNERSLLGKRCNIIKHDDKYSNSLNGADQVVIKKLINGYLNRGPGPRSSRDFCSTRSTTHFVSGRTENPAGLQLERTGSGHP